MAVPNLDTITLVHPNLSTGLIPLTLGEWDISVQAEDISDPGNPSTFAWGYGHVRVVPGPNPVNIRMTPDNDYHYNSSSRVWVQTATGIATHIELNAALGSISVPGNYTVWIFAPPPGPPILHSINTPFTLIAGMNITFRSPSWATVSAYTSASTFVINSGATLTIGDGITLQGVQILDPIIDVSGSLIMSGGVITGHGANAVTVSSGGSFTMNSGIISFNGAGGVIVQSGATFIMNDGSISNNTASVGGGVNSSGTFTMFNGIISDNSAVNGGGVFTNGVFIMHNGTISGNAADDYGGGVHVGASGVLTKSRGIIFGLDGSADENRAGDDGDAVFVAQHGSLGDSDHRPERIRNSTAGQNDSLNSQTTHGWE